MSAIRMHRRCSADSGPQSHLTRIATVAASAAWLLVLAACGSGNNASNRSDSAAGAATAASGAAAGMSASAKDTAHGGMAGMQGMSMTGDPNRDFLRMMSDHHKGLSEMSHQAVERGQSVKADAQRLDKVQDAELDTMVTMLAQQFKDDYTPKVMPSNQPMVDSLKKLSGPALDRAYRALVIQHHQEAIQMMDEYQSKVTDPKVKAMIQRMRADQTKEITDFRRKLGQS